MASVVKLGGSKQPPRAIDYTDPIDGLRKRIRLGKVGSEDAQQVCRLVEKLIACRALGRAPDADTVHWLAGLSDTIHDRIADKGLSEPRNPTTKRATLGEFLAKYLEQRRADLAPASIKRLEFTRKALESHFGPDVPLDSIKPDTAADWRAKLLAEGRAEATVRLEIRNCKSIFGEAVRRELLTRNPFTGLKSSSIAADRTRYVSPAEAAAISDACPDVRWRVLFGLARLAGLRTPSETHRLTWGDVDWQRRRLSVFAPKTGKHRTVPIVPALFQTLQDAFDVAPERSERIVRLSRNNLHRSLEAILKRAGLTPWPDLWQALRRSCETQWALEFPQHVVSDWVGHSVAVSVRHYLQTPDHLLDLAAAGQSLRSAKSAAANPGTQGNGRETGQDDASEKHGSPNDETRVFAGISEESAGLVKVVRGGVEPPTHGFSVHCSTN
jgi:integrase